MLFFCGYRACYCSSSSSSFRSSPVYDFPGRPACGAGCRERSQRSCLRPGGLPSLTQNPGLAATGTVAPPLSRRGLRSWHPGKRAPGCKGQRRFANRASRRCGGCLPVVMSGAIHLFKPLSPGAKTATTVSASPGVKCTSRKTFCPKAGKNFCGLPRTVVSGRGSDAPCGEGSQKGDGEYRREQKAGPRKTSKPRLPKLKR
ncbi:Uncharacterised protein [Escherichia coli]|nr:Uncharacterised protein [Escherichia coli]